MYSNVKLIIEPDDGVAPLLAAIETAKRSVQIAVFRFDHKAIETALRAAAARGVKVAALIAYGNGGGTKNLRKLETRCLNAGITVTRTAGDLARYHDKFFLIDDRLLYVLSFNFTQLDIGSSRGFGLVTSQVKLVREAGKLFQADCTRSPYAPADDSFVVSPVNSRKALGALLRQAQRQLLIYDPRIADKEMLGILQERAQAGVDIRIIGKVTGRTSLSVQPLARCRLHTRTIIVDGRQAFVGSQSLRSAELDARRELGLVIRDPQIVKTLVGTFESDWVPLAEGTKGLLLTSGGTEHQTEKTIQVIERELKPLVTKVKQRVRQAVAKAGVLDHKGLKTTVKSVVKKAVKDALNKAVQEVAAESPTTR